MEIQEEEMIRKQKILEHQQQLQQQQQAEAVRGIRDSTDPRAPRSIQLWWLYGSAYARLLLFLVGCCGWRVEGQHPRREEDAAADPGGGAQGRRKQPPQCLDNQSHRTHNLPSCALCCRARARRLRRP